MEAVTHLEKVIAGEASAVTHLEKVIAQETTAVTYTEKVIAGEASPITHLQKVIAGVARPVTHLEYVWVGGSPPSVQEYTGAVPVTFIADGTPLLDYLISGNTTQSGTPAPDTPIMPNGTGERTAQLIPYPFYSSDGEYAGVQFTTDNGRVIANGTLTSGLLYYLWRPAKFPVGTYTMSVKGKHSGATIYFRDTTHSVSVASIYGTQEGDRSVTFTVTEEISAMVYINAGSGTLDFDCTIMLNAGEEALPFEPTNGYKIPISSAGQTTPVYLGEVESTRRIKKYEFTGQESIVADLPYSRFYFILNNSLIIGVRKTPAFCTHWQVIDDGRPIADVPNNALYSDAGNSRWFIKTTDYTTTDDFKSYLAAQYANGTPVTVWYVLAEPETGIVNEPLMKIGDYADTLSMEQAGVSVPTVAGSNTLDVLTEVKPSEVYIKYKGEPVPQLSMLSSHNADEPEEAPEEAPEELSEEEAEEETSEETESITPETAEE